MDRCEENYLMVGKYDQEFMRKLVKRAYGGTHGGSGPFVEKCSAEAGLSKAVLEKATSKTGRDRVSPLPIPLQEAIVRNSEGRVTMEEVLAANGLVRKETAELLMDTLLPEKKEVQDLRYKKWRDKIESDTNPSGFHAFCKNLEEFCKELDKDTADAVMADKDKLYSSAFFAWALQQYQMSGKDTEKASGAKQILMDLAVRCNKWMEWHFMETPHIRMPDLPTDNADTGMEKDNNAVPEADTQENGEEDVPSASGEENDLTAPEMENIPLTPNAGSNTLPVYLL